MAFRYSEEELLGMLERGVDEGDPRALMILGTCHLIGGARTRRDDRRALKCFKRVADESCAGDVDHHVKADAELLVGLMFERGKGVRRDMKIAINWYVRASRNDSVEAMLHLAAVYMYGSGVQRDMERALQWLDEAALHGSADAMYDIGCIRLNGINADRDYEAALASFQNAVTFQHAGACINLGCMYYGGLGVQRDYIKAKRLFRKAADLGESRGFTYLGHLAYYGLGMKADDRKALSFYQTAAGRKDVEALGVMSDFYRRGELVEKDEDAALRLRNELRSAERELERPDIRMAPLFDEETFISVPVRHIEED